MEGYDKEADVRSVRSSDVAALSRELTVVERALGRKREVPFDFSVHHPFLNLKRRGTSRIVPFHREVPLSDPKGTSELVLLMERIGGRAAT